MVRFCHFGTLNRPVVRAVWAEFLMALFYTYVGCGAFMNLANTVSGSVLAQATAVALAFGLVTVAIGYIFGHVSTFYGNPAVVIAFLLFGKISILRGVLSILFQIAGGLAGAGLLYVSYDSVSESCSYIPNNMSRGEVLLLEIILTSLVSMAIFQAFHSYPYGWIPRNPSRPDLHDNVARDNVGAVSHTGATKALANAVGVGLTVAASHFVAAAVTHVGINPARSFGAAVVSGDSTITGLYPDGTTIDRNCWNGHWVYWVGPILGAILGGLLYKFFLEEPAHQKDLPAQPVVVRTAGVPLGTVHQPTSYNPPGSSYAPAGGYVPPAGSSYASPSTTGYGHHGAATSTATPATAI